MVNDKEIDPLEFLFWIVVGLIVIGVIMWVCGLCGTPDPIEAILT